VVYTTRRATAGCSGRIVRAAQGGEEIEGLAGYRIDQNRSKNSAETITSEKGVAQQILFQQSRWFGFSTLI
jgi:hypothetical protein